MSFVLHPRLMADTAVVIDWTLSRVLLMNDKRFPWLILVPRRVGVSEIFELDEPARGQLMAEIARAGEHLKAWGKTRGCGDKINVANIGNMVPQLHVHVVARAKGDPAWPGTVWNAGTAVPYGAAELSRVVAELRDLL
ncbi:MAG TPA: HIT domain-containing protein [Micropepsaceae bacterium]|jgi:diadenosine tetraphosphate (Ap4A) HIT family hydrolase|nr:HIT domain-containing protein [Micropepsaceae bacterium]